MPEPRVDQDHREWVLQAIDECECRLHRYALRFAGQEDIASDAVQHTFLKLCDASPAELGSRLLPWLFTVCRNRVLDQLRYSGRCASLTAEQRVALEGRELDPASEAEQRDLQAWIRRLIAELPPSSREVLDLTVEGLSYAEVAEVTGMTPGNIRVRVHRALSQLRSHASVQLLLVENDRTYSTTRNNGEVQHEQ